jgi:rare lipoprotein A
MYAMTAAHPILPIPSYVRVTNLKNNKSVVVRVNDRGPFHSDRLIDLSYTAAYKLGVLAGGSTQVRVESIDPTALVSVNTPMQPEAPPAALTEAKTPLLAAPVETSAAAAGGHYVQLGAFSVQENAEQFRGKLKIELAQLGDKLQVYPADGLFRVRAGPFQNLAEASQVATEISNSLNIKAVMTVR